MSLYVIGDLHLSLNADKPMDVFGSKWSNLTEKITDGFKNITNDDYCVLCGDLSWGMNLDDTLPDFKFIDSLPGKKIIIKGNHDYWWSTSNKIINFFQTNNISSLSILNNNSFVYDNCSICGTRGWFYDLASDDIHDKKMINRELVRLKSSLDSAICDDIIVFLHYPPIYGNYCCNEMIDLLSSYNVKRCYYGHIHGNGISKAVNGCYRGIEFRLISADALNFQPIKVI